MVNPVPTRSPSTWNVRVLPMGGTVAGDTCRTSALARHRAHAGSLSRAAFLSARNDAIANVAIIAAGLVTAPTRSLWPDLVVGLGIALMNLDAAREIWGAARKEHRAAEP